MLSNRLRTLLFSVVPTTMLITVSFALANSTQQIAFTLFGLIVVTITAIARFNKNPPVLWVSQLFLLLLLCFAAFYFTSERDIGISLGLNFIIICIFSENFFVQRQRRTALTLFAIASVFGWIAVVEVFMPPGFAVVGQNKDEKYPKEVWRQQWKKDFYDKTDKSIGWKPHPGAVVEATAMLSPKQQEWQVQYTIGDDGQRIVPNRPENGPSILLLGGSFTFGHGLSDENTIAANLQKLQPEDRVFSHAVNAYGTAQSLLRLENANESNIAWVFYFSIDNHMNRNAGNAHWMRKYPTTPLFELNESGELVPRESVLSGIDGRVDRFLAGRSYLYEKLQTISPWIKPDDWKVDLTTALIARMNEVAHTKSSSPPEFVVVFVPQLDHAEQESTRQQQLIERVAEVGIASLNVRSHVDKYLKQNADVTRRDLYDVTSSHPTPLFSRLIAEWCNEYIAEHTPAGRSMTQSN